MKITAVAAGAAVAAGVWLRWAARPVLAAYRLGRVTGSAQAHR